MPNKPPNSHGNAVSKTLKTEVTTEICKTSELKSMTLKQAWFTAERNGEEIGGLYINVSKPELIIRHEGYTATVDITEIVNKAMELMGAENGFGAS